MVVDDILEKVSIKKDQWGIPHIEAKNQHDALFAYGYTVAKDRLFQMDIQRRLARGELSEILGEDLIEIDKMFRAYLISYKAKQYLSDTSKISSDALKYIDAYIQGVNYFIKTGPKTIEHRLIREEVRPFDRLDVASMTIYMSFSLMDGIRRDMLFSMLKEKISKNDLAIIFPDYADNNFLTIMEEQIDSIPKRNYSNEEQMSDSAYKKLISYFDLTEKVTGLVPPFHGSNSWVLSPSRSSSRNAILANDPHIGLSKPDVWYEAHISYPGYNNYGYYIPTIPFPLIGHDDFKAWGMTMFENDEVDLYKETFNPENENQVFFDGKWENSQVIKEQIKVKDNSPEDLNIRVTSHGPIISDYIDGYTGSPLAFSWVFYNLENPRKFISVNQTKTSRSNPYLAWGRTGFHGGWSDNTDSESWRTYAWSFDPTDSDHTIDTQVFDGSTDSNSVIKNDNSFKGSNVTNKTGNYSLVESRTGLHGGNYTTCYPVMAQIDWWGNYGNADSNYGGNFGADAE